MTPVMTKTMILATRNKGKLREFNHAFEGTGIEFQSLLEMDGAPDPEETGETYEDNALIKARQIALHTGMATVADDSGIEIDALPGELGVKSARVWGGMAYDKINDILLERLRGSTTRSTRYVCAIAYVDPATGVEELVKATCEGVIHDRQEGAGGFGYDPIFFVPQFGKTMAQLPLETKNRISHRAKAMELLKEKLIRS
ncbi:MAG: RdgB/HAM1 family non-canonical purine NTP pyrophosphatase [Nitrospinota bacterium]|nr:RdgB/HAM1 family non-canonical purine NTP pyrophosphatase [Nitrospinota bacterium]